MPLPDAEARQAMVSHKLKDTNSALNEADFDVLMKLTEGYSCSDLQAVVKEAAMCPVRELTSEQLMQIKDTKEIRAICLNDF
jgi:SpoVK/Ycf46/Vps4 family AAA+-type ATPase